MRIVVAALAILSLFAGLSGEATAQGYTKKRHKHAKAQVRQPANRAQPSTATSDYIVANGPGAQAAVETRCCARTAPARAATSVQSSMVVREGVRPLGCARCRAQ